jgi:hypothetical protein
MMSKQNIEILGDAPISFKWGGWNGGGSWVFDVIKM